MSHAAVKTSIASFLVGWPFTRRIIQNHFRLSHQMRGIDQIFTRAAPSDVNAIDIFRGEWSSDIAGFDTGEHTLFDDSRIKWFGEQLGGFAGKHILELGPLEAGHSTMMEHAGGSVLGIEANQRAYLKCLVVKEVMRLQARFLYGDFRPFLKSTSERFDFVLACAVLYHMTDPVDLLRDIAKVTDRFGLWTVYYDEKVVKSRPLLLAKFDPEPVISEVDGFETRGFRYNYMTLKPNPKFCGGISPTSVWLTRDCLLSTIEKLGFKITITDDDQNHQVGPALLLYASRR